MIRILPTDQTIAFINANPNKFIVYISSCAEQEDLPEGLHVFEELVKAAPYLKNWLDGDQTEDNNMVQVISDQRGCIICDTREEMESIYYQTVGDDGPNDPQSIYVEGPGNLYSGCVRWYALTINDMGETENENT